MFHTRTPHAILQHQAAILRGHLPGLFDGRHDCIHDARITTRRIREVLPLTHEWQRRHVADELFDALKYMGRSLGRVRDADVRIELLRYLESRVPPAAAMLVTVRQDQVVDRVLRTRKLVKRLERLDVARELARLEHGAEWHPTRFWVGLTGMWRSRLRRLLAERAQAATAAMAHATGVYFPNRMHEARIAIKKFRYCAEIGAETGILVDPALLRDLKKTQDVLGDLHDRQTLVDELEAGMRGARAEHQDHVRLVVQVLHAEAADQHRRFLERRPRLVQACERAQRAVQRVQPSATTVAAAGALALTGLEALRRQRADRRVHERRTEPEVLLRIPVTIAERRAHPR